MTKDDAENLRAAHKRCLDTQRSYLLAKSKTSDERRAFDRSEEAERQFEDLLTALSSAEGAPSR